MSSKMGNRNPVRTEPGETLACQRAGWLFQHFLLHFDFDIEAQIGNKCFGDARFG